MIPMPPYPPGIGRLVARLRGAVAAEAGALVEGWRQVVSAPVSPSPRPPPATGEVSPSPRPPPATGEVAPSRPAAPEVSPRKNRPAPPPVSARPRSASASTVASTAPVVAAPDAMSPPAVVAEGQTGAVPPPPVHATPGLPVAVLQLARRRAESTGSENSWTSSPERDAHGPEGVDPPPPAMPALAPVEPAVSTASDGNMAKIADVAPPHIQPGDATTKPISPQGPPVVARKPVIQAPGPRASPLTMDPIRLVSSPPPLSSPGHGAPVTPITPVSPTKPPPPTIAPRPRSISLGPGSGPPPPPLAVATTVVESAPGIPAATQAEEDVAGDDALWAEAEAELLARISSANTAAGAGHDLAGVFGDDLDPEFASLLADVSAELQAKQELAS